MLFLKKQGHEEEGEASHRKKKKGGGLTSIIQIFFSLIIFAILGFGLYLAYRNFSGVDPLSFSPATIVKSVATSDAAADLLTGLLTVSPSESLQKLKQLLSNEEVIPEGPRAPLLFSFAVIADPHTDPAKLAEALTRAKEENAQFIVGLGDLSDVGTLEELRSIKLQYDAQTLPYYIVPGDHDLWDSRNRNLPALSNFKEVFGESTYSFAHENTRFLLIDNSDNYRGVDTDQMSWIEGELERESLNPSEVFIVVADIPLYHPSSDHVMGKENERLKTQAEHLLDLFEKNGVDGIFFADTHFFSKYREPETGIPMYTVGAVTSVRNPQVPRFVMVDIFEDGSYNVREIELK